MFILSNLNGKKLQILQNALLIKCSIGLVHIFNTVAVIATSQLTRVTNHPLLITSCLNLFLFLILQPI